MPVISLGTYSPYAFESVTANNANQSLTAATYTSTGAKSAKAFIGPLESGQVRWRIDGTAPASDEGHLLEIGQTLVLENLDQIENFKVIRTGSANGTLKVTYLKR